MSAISHLISLLLFAATLAGSTPRPTPLPETRPLLDIFPEKTILLARVASASPDAWKPAFGGHDVRSVSVRWRIGKILKGEAKKLPADKTISVTFRQTRWGGGRHGDPGPWGDHEFSPGEVLLVLSAERELTQALAKPSSVWLAGEALVVVSDVEWIVAGQKLDAEDQGSRLLAFLAETQRPRSLFLGRYLAVLAAASKGSTRASLLDRIANIETQKLDEDGKAELLRALHVEILMREGPPADAPRALLFACLRTVAAWEGKELEISPRLESVASVYLPWLVTKSSNWQRSIPDFPPAERTRARKALERLSSEEALPQPTRKALEELVQSLR